MQNQVNSKEMHNLLYGFLSGKRCHCIFKSITNIQDTGEEEKRGFMGTQFILCFARVCVCVCVCAVSYTHLTLPTRSTV